MLQRRHNHYGMRHEDGSCLHAIPKALYMHVCHQDSSSEVTPRCRIACNSAPYNSPSDVAADASVSHPVNHTSSAATDL